jgi:hypothetical protein
MDTLDILINLVRERDRDEYWQKHKRCDDFPPHVVLILFVQPKDPAERARYFTETPRVEIYRQCGQPNDGSRSAVQDACLSPSPLEELISLSHELGHHDSAVTRGSLVFDTMAEEEEYEEEVRAWVRARDILARTPFSEWDAFDERQRESLKGYRDGYHLTADVAQEIEDRVREASK